MRRRISLFSVMVALVLGMTAPALAGTGNRDNCGKYESGVNAMKSATGTYSVVTYPRICWKRYFNGNNYTYWLPWTKTPPTAIHGTSIGSDVSVTKPVAAKRTHDSGGNVTSVRYDFTVKVKTSAGSAYIPYQLWVYSSGSSMRRINPSGSVTYDDYDYYD